MYCDTDFVIRHQQHPPPPSAIAGAPHQVCGGGPEKGMARVICRSTRVIDADGAPPRGVYEVLFYGAWDD
jgi:hypothetical protein